MNISWHFWWVTQLMDCSVSCELLIFLRYSSIIFVWIAIFFSAFSKVPFTIVEGSAWKTYVCNSLSEILLFLKRDILRILYIVSHLRNCGYLSFLRYNRNRFVWWMYHYRKCQAPQKTIFELGWCCKQQLKEKILLSRELSLCQLL